MESHVTCLHHLSNKAGFSILKGRKLTCVSGFESTFLEHSSPPPPAPATVVMVAARRAAALLPLVLAAASPASAGARCGPTLPAGCDLDCLFAKHPWLAGEIEHTGEAVERHFRKHNRTICEHMCTCAEETPGQGRSEPKADTAGGLAEEAAAAEGDGEDPDDAIDRGVAAEKQLRGAARGGGAATLPPGCDLNCFFANHPWLEDEIEHTTEAVERHFRQNHKKVLPHACICPEKTSSAGHSEPEAAAAAAEGASEETVPTEQGSEDAHGADGAVAATEAPGAREGEGGAKAILPPGCNLDCFFKNHPFLAVNVEHTEEAVRRHFQKHPHSLDRLACDCRKEASAAGRAEPKVDAAGGATEEMPAESEVEESEHGDSGNGKPAEGGIEAGERDDLDGEKNGSHGSHDREEEHRAAAVSAAAAPAESIERAEALEVEAADLIARAEALEEEAASSDADRAASALPLVVAVFAGLVAGLVGQSIKEKRRRAKKEKESVQLPDAVFAASRRVSVQSLETDEEEWWSTAAASDLESDPKQLRRRSSADVAIAFGGRRASMGRQASMDTVNHMPPPLNE